MAKPLTFRDFLTVDYAPGMPDIIKKNAKKRKGMDVDSGVVEARGHAGSIVTIKDGSKVTKHKVQANPAAHHIAQELRKTHSHLGDLAIRNASRDLAAGKKHTAGSSSMTIDNSLPRVMEEVQESRNMKGVTFTLKKSVSDGKKVCTACSGSGRYDNTGSPKCSACGGTGYQPVKESIELDEALTSSQRRERSMQMRRMSSRIAIGRARAERTFATPDRLKHRATRAARALVFKKMTKGIPKDELTYARRAEIEKRLDTPAFKARLDRIAMKLLPLERKMEIERHRVVAAVDVPKK